MEFLGSTATNVKPGFLRSMRAAKRKSCQDVSKKDSQPAERTTSFVTSRLPRSRRTARSASLRLMACFIFSVGFQQAQVWNSPHEAFHDTGGPVGGLIIHHQDLADFRLARQRRNARLQ
jgi:hypothetical protein